jgi:CCR4-NOT transcription complex subunit 2
MASSEPVYSTPPCYINHPPSFKTEHITKVPLESLFYMFYSMPRDIMQAYAAQELYRREYRFHTELKIWMKAAPVNPNVPVPTAPFVFFDISLWEQR